MKSFYVEKINFAYCCMLIGTVDLRIVPAVTLGPTACTLGESKGPGILGSVWLSIV